MTGKEEDALARAIYDALAQSDDNAYLGPFDIDKRITIDGAFNLRLAAQSLMKDPVIATLSAVSKRLLRP
jgi:hypothetical protein